MNALALFALLVHDMTLVGIAKAIVLIVAVIAIVIIVMRVCGITLPPWLLQILVIVAVVVVALLAIDLIASL